MTTLLRYKKHFRDPDGFLDLLSTIPFLNGGLFECLDKPDQVKKGRCGGDHINRIDGFSDKDIELSVPDYLFFGSDTVNLSEGLHVEKVLVNGLINILESYKFTI